MQYSTLSYLKKEAVSKTLIWLLKALVLMLMVYFVGRKIYEGQLSPAIIADFSLQLFTAHPWYAFPVPFLLIFVNWGLEGKKWQLLSAPVSLLSLAQACRAVLSGLSLGFITPRSLGDYAGRLMESRGEERLKLVGAVLLNRISQSFCTYLAGMAGILYLVSFTAMDLPPKWLQMVPLLAGGVLLCLFFLSRSREKVVKALRQLTGRKWSHLIEIIGDYSSRTMMLVLGWAALRYTVYTFQFVWILKMTGIALPLPVLFAGVAAVFVLKSIIPTFNFLSDLGVREFSALFVFSAFAVPEGQLVLASLLVWCLNILLPALVGTFYILQMRFTQSRC